MKLIITLIFFMMSVFNFELKEIDFNKQAIKTIITYKTIGDNSLKLIFFTSGGVKKKPVIVFFHPGGWFSGDPNFFEPQAQEFSLAGYNAISVQYRLADFKTTTPVDCIDDAIDALKYLDTHQEELNLDMSKLFLIGYSAGGHIAMMSQLSKNKSIPTAKKIFAIASPVLLTEDELLKKSSMTVDEKINISPMHHIKNLKESLFLFSGTNDEYITYSSIENFENKAKQHGKCVELVTFKNAGHFLLTYYENEIEEKIKLEIDNSVKK